MSRLFVFNVNGRKGVGVDFTLIFCLKRADGDRVADALVRTEEDEESCAWSMEGFACPLTHANVKIDTTNAREITNVKAMAAKLGLRVYTDAEYILRDPDDSV